MSAAGTGPALTEASIRQLASTESFRRGRECVEDGSVRRLVRRGSELLAEVQGSDNALYRVRVTPGALGADGAFSCTCPYDWGGACKHVVAALLAFRETPDNVEARPDAAQLLHGLDRDQLQALLLALVERQPELADWIEVHVQALLAAQPLQSPTSLQEGQDAYEQRAWARQQARETRRARRRQAAAVDPAPFRRQVRAALRSLDRMSGSEAYWHVGGVASEIVNVARQAQPFIEVGDGRSALTVLEAVTAEYVEGWTDLDDSDGEAGDAFAELAPLWTESLLRADLSTAERRRWADTLSTWQKELDDYGIDDVFDAPQIAALQGWDDPQVERALRGEAPAAPARRQAQDGKDGISRRWDAGEVARARLRILMRQGRAEEYLNLARAEGLVTEYAADLARLGRPAEAVAYGLAAFQEQGTLANYQAVQALAGERWPALREELLAKLRARTTFDLAAPVDIFLHEGLVDDAIAVLDANPTTTAYPFAVVERVADAAIQTRPEWVIQTVRRQAERIMDGGKSQYYREAARWLERMRDAATAAGRTEEWRAYINELLATHKRKYSLVPLLKQVLGEPQRRT